MVLNSLAEVTPSQFAIAGTLALLAWYIFVPKRQLPKSLPWIGKKGNGFFAESKASWSSFSNVENWLTEGYSKYSKLGKSYILPNISGNPEIILPNDKLQWLVNHSDDEASVREVHFDQLAGKYAFSDPYLLGTVYHEHVIHKNLTRKLNSLLPHTWDEVTFQLDSFLGHDTKHFKEITIQETLMKIVAAVSNRMFVGRSLCRNEEFLTYGGKFANGVGLFTAFWALVPKVLRPVLGPLMAIPNNSYARVLRKHTMPVVLQRIADLDYNDAHPETPREIPEDYVTWHIRQARLEGKLKEQDPEMVCKFLLPVIFAAIHTTTFTIVNVVLDLIGSDPKLGYLEGIREEVERVYAECNGEWTKQSLTQLVRTDSAIRESMRVSTFLTRSVMRKVVKPEGLKSEEGWVAPKGTVMGFDAWTRHHDPDIYPDPYTFDAFRFSKQVEASDTYLDAARLSFISTGENFLPFGHGRHACPGRFFINQELKMILAHLLMKYDVQYLPERPKNVWMGQAVIPPAGAKMSVRRKS